MSVNNPRILIYSSNYKNYFQNEKHLKELKIKLGSTINNIIYTSAEDYLHDSVEYLVNDVIDPKKIYKKCELLFIQKLDEICNIPLAQEIFLEIILGSTNPKQQVIITCDRHPTLINDLSSEFKSYLSTGKIFKI